MTDVNKERIIEVTVSSSIGEETLNPSNTAVRRPKTDVAKFER
jgi:hypothetical protein